MSKKKKLNAEALSAFQGKRSEELNIESISQMADLVMEQMPEDQKQDFFAMFTLASRGISPEEYAKFYDIFHLTESFAEKFSEDDDEDDFFPFGAGGNKKRSPVKEYTPLKDAAEQTLILKIQMKDVCKPPMWREVEIPADCNFLQLHEVIQEVTGLEDSHLWQFNAKAYDDSLLIGVEMDEDEFCPGLDYITHDAEATPVTQFLQQKGDKLEYVYDFGDDWIFTVEVKELVKKKIEHPVCRKYKSELNAIENIGGVLAYQTLRNIFDNWGSLSDKEKKQNADQWGFDSVDDYLEFLNEGRINIDDVNDALSFI
ncbi:MAG: plasmid pRiA4b ORF-3 family protein [Muribaculaceae bacterium]|nr:plasmid pRiA4b ORF-3 family protein [Muribaculaceae bacterium]